MSLGTGIHSGGKLTRLTDAAISVRYLLGKQGTDKKHVAVAVAGNRPYCVIEDEAHAAEATVGIGTLGGSAKSTMRVAVDSGVSANDLLVLDDNGYAKTLPGVNGTATTYFLIGRALEDAIAGETVEFDPIPAVKELVPAA